eukprot:4272752-Prymnesium_polylepis.1
MALRRLPVRDCAWGTLKAAAMMAPTLRDDPVDAELLMHHVSGGLGSRDRAEGWMGSPSSAVVGLLMYRLSGHSWGRWAGLRRCFHPVASPRCCTPLLHLAAAPRCFTSLLHPVCSWRQGRTIGIDFGVDSRDHHLLPAAIELARSALPEHWRLISPATLRKEKEEKEAARAEEARQVRGRATRLAPPPGVAGGVVWLQPLYAASSP